MADDNEPAMTIREMVREVYADVKEIHVYVGILKEANLPRRVDILESFKDSATGGSQKVTSVDTTVRGWLQPILAAAAIVVGVLIAVSK